MPALVFWRDWAAPDRKQPVTTVTVSSTVRSARERDGVGVSALEGSSLALPHFQSDSVVLYWHGNRGLLCQSKHGSCERHVIRAGCNCTAEDLTNENFAISPLSFSSLTVQYASLV